MIVATVFVYGHNNQVNWSEWRFLQLPAPGDVIRLTDYAGNNHYAKVRHTEYSLASVHRDDDFFGGYRHRGLDGATPAQ